MRKLNIILSFCIVLETLQTYLLWKNFNAIGWLRAVALSTDERPFVYRVLIPFLSRVLHFLTGIDIVYCIIFLFSLSAVGGYFAIIYLLRSFDIDGAEVKSFVVIQVMLVISIYGMKVYDYATLMFFALSLGLLARGKHGVYLLLFPIATLNRETTFLLTIFYLVYFWKKIPFPKLFLSVGLQGLVYVVLKLLIQAVFVDNGGVPIWLGWWFVPLEYLKNPFSILIFASFCFIIWQAKFQNEFIKTAILTIVPLQILLHFFFGMPFELRVFAESIPLISFTTLMINIQPLE